MGKGEGLKTLLGRVVKARPGSNNSYPALTTLHSPSPC